MIDVQKIERLKKLQQEMDTITEGVKTGMYQTVATLLAETSSLSPELYAEFVLAMVEDERFFSGLRSLVEVDSSYDKRMEREDWIVRLGGKQLVASED